MPEYELLYWPITGLGEPIRIMFALGGIALKDSTRQTDDKWMDRKSSYLPMQVPILLVDGEPMDQSKSIMRYLGKIFTYEGKPLYPTDPKEAYLCDNLMDLIDDARGPLNKTFAIQDQAEKEAARAAMFNDDGPLTKFLNGIDKVVAGRIGKDVNIGDVYTFSITNMFRTPTFLDGVPDGALSKYENLTKFHAWMANLPPIKEKYKDAEGIRVTFKPL